MTPDRLMTLRLAVSIVENRPPHSGHWRRRRMLSPSSLVRESMTRESGWRQNGQCMAGKDYPTRLRVGRTLSEPRGDGLAVGGELLCLGERHDRVADLRESSAV